MSVKNTVNSSKVKVGDEIGIGDVAYRIIEIADSFILGQKIVEQGHLIQPSSYRSQLDLRLSGWEFLYRMPTLTKDKT